MDPTAKKNPGEILMFWAVLLSLAALLAGCAGSPLPEREIVRGILMEKEAQGYAAMLLLADTGQAEVNAWKMAAGTGATPALALHAAEKQVNGTIFYGLTDFLCLPEGTNWQTATDIAAAVQEITAPSPEISVVMAAPSQKTMAEQAAALYQEIPAVEKACGLHCGIETVFANRTAAAIPQVDDGQYRMVLVAKGKPGNFTAQGSAAQLAALLCGQTHRLAIDFAGGQASCRADASLWYRAAARPPGTLTVTLVLKNLRLQVFEGASQAGGMALLREQLAQDLARLTEYDAGTEADLFRLQFWYALRTTRVSTPANVRLTVYRADGEQGKD